MWVVGGGCNLCVAAIDRLSRRYFRLTTYYGRPVPISQSFRVPSPSKPSPAREEHEQERSTSKCEQRRNQVFLPYSSPLSSLLSPRLTGGCLRYTHTKGILHLVRPSQGHSHQQTAPHLTTSLDHSACASPFARPSVEHCKGNPLLGHGKQVDVPRSLRSTLRSIRTSEYLISSPRNSSALSLSYTSRRGFPPKEPFNSHVNIRCCHIEFCLETEYYIEAEAAARHHCSLLGF